VAELTQDQINQAILARLKSLELRAHEAEDSLQAIANIRVRAHSSLGPITKATLGEIAAVDGWLNTTGHATVED
jgi:uncharacterized protein YkwD